VPPQSRMTLSSLISTGFELNIAWIRPERMYSSIRLALLYLIRLKESQR
jgi:hypothetical protein